MYITDKAICYIPPTRYSRKGKTMKTIKRSEVVGWRGTWKEEKKMNK